MSKYSDASLEECLELLKKFDTASELFFTSLNEVATLPEMRRGNALYLWFKANIAPQMRKIEAVVGEMEALAATAPPAWVKANLTGRLADIRRNIDRARTFASTIQTAE